MRNICFLIGNLNNSGGTERVTSIIANELSVKGYNVTILSLFSGMQPFFELNQDVGFYSLHPRKISFKKNFFNTIIKIRNFIKNNNIETLIVVDSISCVFTVPALMGLNVKHICWEHFNFNVDMGIRLRGWGRKLAAKYCDYIITLTERDKALWEKGIKNVYAEIIPITNPTPYKNIKHMPSLSSKTIIAIGRLTYQKGFDLLIEAWAKVARNNIDWKLIIVGNGGNEEMLKEQARKLGVWNSIDFVPETKNIEFYYAKSSFYCLSSRFEGLPMVLLEAQSYGLPIISFDCDTGPSEIIEHNINGYIVENGNIEELQCALEKACNLSIEEYKNLVFNSKNNCYYFEPNALIKKWLEVV